MEPTPDVRWSNILGGLSPERQPIPMSFAILRGLSDEWALLLEEPIPEGIGRLLATSRSLFAHSWFDYEFMVVAAYVSLQAVEATFRQVVFADRPESEPFRSLVRRASDEGWLAADLADRLDAAVQLRNWLSHPQTQASFTVGMAAPMLETSHQVVNFLCSYDFVAWRA